MDKLTLPKNEPERWLNIKFQLELRGYSFARLARETGVARCSMTNTKRVWLYKNMEAIAKKLGLTPQEIWPERYGDDARPKFHSSRYPRESNTRILVRQRKNQKRARQ